MTVSRWEPGTQYNYGDIVEFEGMPPGLSQPRWFPTLIVLPKVPDTK